MNYFHLNISLDSIDNNEEKRPLKNLKELVSINEAYYIYKTQIFRINYQKYSVYKEWAEINTYMLDNNNKEFVLPNKINNTGLGIENTDNSEEKEKSDDNKISPIIEKNEFQKVNLQNIKLFTINVCQ